jgi:hypothetical protein
MKKIAIVAALAAAALATNPASAGVVITQDQSATGPFGEKKSTQTIMIQGNKQKMVSKDREVITDLDNNVMYLIDPAKKSYIQLPFPPTGPMAAAVAHSAGAMDFKKTESTEKVLGYSCTDYTGSGTSMGGQYTVTECFSTGAPGAQEFTRFQKAMATKLKDIVPMSNTPDGIPLASSSSVQMSNMKLPNLTPEQQQKLQEQIAKVKPVLTRTTVSKVETKDLPADTFSVPSGFTERKLTLPPLPPSPAASPGASH